VTRNLLLAAVAFFVLVGATLIAQSARDTQTSPKLSAALRGTWVANGLVESSRGGTDQPAGTRLSRQWIFLTSCTADGRCEPWLAREAADGLERARLDQPDDRLIAVFTRRTAGCNTQQTGELKRTFRITPTTTGGTLQASETVKGVYPGCSLSGGDGLVSASLTWTVTKVSPSCPGLQDCRGQR
jgi:hypothetical protein